MQYVIQRISSAKSMKIAYWGAISGALSFIILGYISPSIGAYAKVLLPNLARPDLAYPSLLKEVLPPGLAAFAASGLLAAIMSTGDSYLLAPATLVANDFYRIIKPEATPKESLVVARIFTIIYIILGLWVALIFKVILQLTMTFLGIGMAMLPAFIASTCWKGATSKGAFWSLAIGGAINSIIIKYPPSFLVKIDPSLRGWTGFTVATIILIAISLLKPENTLKSTVEELLSKVAI
jgi:SSS family solute:Na+ symporter